MLRIFSAFVAAVFMLGSDQNTRVYLSFSLVCFGFLYLVHSWVIPIPNPFTNFTSFVGCLVIRVILCLFYIITEVFFELVPKVPDVNALTLQRYKRLIWRRLSTFFLVSTITLYFVSGIFEFNPQLFIIYSVMTSFNLVSHLVEFMAKLVAQYLNAVEAEGWNALGMNRREVIVLFRGTALATKRLFIGSGVVWILRAIYNILSHCPVDGNLYTCLLLNGTRTNLEMVGLTFVFANICYVIVKVCIWTLDGSTEFETSSAHAANLAFEYAIILANVSFMAGSTNEVEGRKVPAFHNCMFLVGILVLNSIHSKVTFFFKKKLKFSKYIKFQVFFYFIL